MDGFLTIQSSMAVLFIVELTLTCERVIICIVTRLKLFDNSR